MKNIIYDDYGQPILEEAEEVEEIKTGSIPMGWDLFFHF
jgi:hypothetical protein